MKKQKPLIKFNSGNPIALCNRCFVIMCSVTYNNETEESSVLDIKGDNEGDYISTPIGKTPPSYCDKCSKLLTYSINE
jgi:hypothetical protein